MFCALLMRCDKVMVVQERNDALGVQNVRVLIKYNISNLRCIHIPLNLTHEGGKFVTFREETDYLYYGFSGKCEYKKKPLC